MKPRVRCRVLVVLAPLAVLVTILAAFDGAWLLAALGAVTTASSVVNLRDARRRGMSWNGPKTFRELRDAQAQSRDASGPSPIGRRLAFRQQAAYRRLG